jgi:hypothetical protein
MTIARKLQIPTAAHVVVLARPDGIDLEIPPDCVVTSTPADALEATAIIAFLVRSGDVEAVAGPALAAARDDRLAWIAYPKARQLGTDLNRDVLAALATERGVQPVRQVAIDGVWSALRFRPAEVARPDSGM